MAAERSDLRSDLRSEDRDWLALQFAGALKPIEATGWLRRGLAPHEVLRRLPAEGRVAAERVDDALRTLRRLDARLLGWGRPGYPERLAPFVDAAPVLGLRGDPEALTQPAVAVVGSRAASDYGLQVARRLAAELAEAGVCVVSGLAFGIDAAAHRAALDAGGRTVAVQACGLDHVYPAAHRRLAQRIVERGALLSEFPIGMRPRPAFFPLRNRLISGLGAALVVVEARLRSGSLTSARHAADQGVEVFAVPGPITLPGHAGSNTLLREGAAPLLDTADVLAALGQPAPPKPPPGETPLAEGAAELLERLRRAPSDADTLARGLGRPAAEVAPLLLELELAGRAERGRDGRWRALS